MTPTNEDIVNKLINGEDYFASLMNINSDRLEIGLPIIKIKKINYTFHIISALRYRVDKEIFDTQSVKLYYKIIKLLPINWIE